MLSLSSQLADIENNFEQNSKFRSISLESRDT